MEVGPHVGCPWGPAEVTELGKGLGNTPVWIWDSLNMVLIPDAQKYS